jgi:hypothetical protein
VELAVDGIVDRGGCGREIAFYDPDGRKIELNTYGNLISFEPSFDLAFMLKC